ncbi:uncharacterized protein PAC_15921 [Phialocephala subalpina]|uniref:Uncharacterized protein n=1 Tax=Phialocephala subalpina TaxID=576137 RepID=A0A1L7XLT3_9HELO|nr:uncharacterized protein PAC_15921 [Phialocephala subalpina]
MTLSTDQARDVATQPKFITAVRMVLDIFARLDQADTETIAAKVQPHKLSMMSDDIISRLGQMPDLIEEIAPSTVDADKETGEYRSPLSQYPQMPSMSPGLEPQCRRAMPNMSRDQACRDIETSKGLSILPPIVFGVQRQAHVLERASTAMKIREPSHSHRATSPIPSALGSPIASMQGSLLLSHSGPARGAWPDRRQPDEDSIVPNSSTDGQLALPTPAQQTDTALEDHPSRYVQAFSHMTSLFGTTLSPAQLVIIIRTGDKLVRDDAVPFLTDQLPLWKGMWHESNLLMPSRSDSITDHFVKVSRCIAIMNERSAMDRIRILLHRVLQYQFYLRFLEKVKQRVKNPEVKRERGVRDAAYALNHLLEKLYIDDWDLTGPAEKQRRRNLLHKQKHLGKRLVTLSCCMGFGILLLGSPEAMGRINDTEFTDDMLDALVCYVFSTYPEVPKLCKMLDKVVRQMVKSQTVSEMKFHIENITPSIENFLESRDDLMPPSQFTRVNLSMYRADPLELFPARLHNRTDLIQHLWIKGTQIYGEERVSRLACKRRRISF